MESTTSLANRDSQSLIDKTPDCNHQYSYYAIDVTGVPHISITEDYLWIVIVRSAMQTAIN